MHDTAPVSYDFRPPRSVAERQRTLEAMHERLAASLQSWLAGKLREPVQLTVERVEQLAFGEFARALPAPRACYLVDVNGERARGVIELGRELAFLLVERLFGGSGPATVPERALTPIERMAVRTVADRVAALVRECWADHVALELGLSGFESVPELLRAADDDTPVLVATLRVAAGELVSPLSVMLPLTALDAFFTVRAARAASPSSDAMPDDSPLDARVTVSARLPEFRVSVRELSALAEGAVLSTGVPADAELRLFVGDQPRALAAAGRVGPRLAVRLLDDLSPASAKAHGNA